MPHNPIAYESHLAYMVRENRPLFGGVIQCGEVQRFVREDPFIAEALERGHIAQQGKEGFIVTDSGRERLKSRRYCPMCGRHDD